MILLKSETKAEKIEKLHNNTIIEIENCSTLEIMKL